MMKNLLYASTLIFCFAIAMTMISAVQADSPATQPASPLQFTMKLLDGREKDLADYQGNVVLIVNTASHCGFTRQFTGLENLHQKYKDRGLVVLGFPSNDFNQEEDSSEGISNICHGKYGVTFDVFSPIHVKGEQIDPLYAILTSPEHNKANPGVVAWNFEKFLIGRDGKIINRYSSKVEPESQLLIEAIETELVK